MKEDTDGRCATKALSQLILDLKSELKNQPKLLSELCKLNAEYMLEAPTAYVFYDDLTRLGIPVTINTTGTLLSNIPFESLDQFPGMNLQLAINAAHAVYVPYGKKNT